MHQDTPNISNARERVPSTEWPRVRPIALKDLRNEPEEMSRRVHRGEELIVYRYSEPMFRLIRPYDNERIRAIRRKLLGRPGQHPEARSIW